MVRGDDQNLEEIKLEIDEEHYSLISQAAKLRGISIENFIQEAINFLLIDELKNDI